MERQAPLPETGSLVLVSHPLCPYVQRAAIVLLEKGIPFERREVDLARKPEYGRSTRIAARVPAGTQVGAGVEAGVARPVNA